MTAKAWLSATLGVVCLCAAARPARAEVTLAKPADNWEVYTSGRVGAFAEVLQGRGVPLGQSPHLTTQEGVIVTSADSSDGTANTSGDVLAYRVRSGFLGNIASIGVRHQMTESTLVTGQISIWSTIESQGQRTYQKNLPDVREGYVKVQGPGGTLLAGRALSLFGRGATEIDFLYGHGFGVGAPQGFNDQGPSAGHIGFGVLANVFAAGVAYATPSAAGLQLTVGYYDAGVLVGQRYSRAKLGRPEASLTYDAEFSGNGKLHVFLEGAFQKLYDTNGTNESKNVYGAQGGARLEVGPVHVGVAGFTGKGLGLNYFLSQSDSINNQASNNMRPFDGAYVQAQVALGRVDLNAGWGITRAHQMTEDLDVNLSANQPEYVKTQMGISGVAVYHFSKYFHGAFDYFRAQTDWWYGSHQAVNAFNVGMIATW